MKFLENNFRQNGADCYHDYYPVIPGISEPTYTEEELAEMNRKGNIPVKYGDKEYTKYEALQRQRRLETTMRAQREKIHLLKLGNADEDDIIAARCRYRGTSQEYTRFSKAMDLPQQRQRVTVDGLGNIGVGKWKTTGERLSAQLPKGFKERRSIGEKISEKDLNTFVEKADMIGVKLHITNKSDFGGFEDYRGDVKVLFEALEHIKNNQPLLTKVTGDDKITLKYKYIFDGSGKIDTGTFASSEGRTITLNKFMYDDSAWLAREYEKEVEKGRFVKGTTYKNIIDHELGHIIGKTKRNLYEKTAIVCKKRARLYYMYESEYIIEFISKYATANDKELFAEINSLLNSEFPDEAEEIFKEVGLL